MAYASRLLTSSEVNYSITKKECLALVWSLQKFRPFIWGCKVIIITDHEALCWLRTKKDLAGRLARWSLCLQEYEVQIQYRSGKLHQNADCLSRNPLLTQEEVLEERCLEVGSMIMDPLDLELQDVRLEFVKKQREVTEWKIIMERIEAKRSVGRHFCLLDGRLFKQKSVYGRTYLRLCVPPEYRSLILNLCHDDPVAGNLGIQRTLTKIIGRFFWNTLTEDVTRYVKSCLLCQKRKSVCSLPTGMLQTIKVERPFQKIGVDLLGPFPTSVNGNKMLIVAVDYLTKWVELEALPTGKADVVTQFIVDKIVLRHGAPESIINR